MQRIMIGFFNKSHSSYLLSYIRVYLFFYINISSLWHFYKIYRSPNFIAIRIKFHDFKVFLEILLNDNLQPDFQTVGTNVFRNLSTLCITYQKLYVGGRIGKKYEIPFFFCILIFFFLYTSSAKDPPTLIWTWINIRGTYM